MRSFPGRQRYLSYIFRCWEESGRQPGEGEMWRFSLEDIRSGQRRGFASLEALLAYIRTEMEDGPPTNIGS